MSYRDPYGSQYAAGTSGRYYGGGQQQYPETAQEYSNSYPPHQTYDNMGGYEAHDPYASSSRQPYSDDRPPKDDYGYQNNQRSDHNNYPPPQRSATQTSTSGLSRTLSKSLSKKGKPSVSVMPVRKEESGFEQGEFTPGLAARKSRTPRALREYRYDHQGNLWTKGGRGRCAGRVCCCTFMTTVFLIVSVVLSLALWVRPPTIEIGDVQTMTVNGATIQQVTDGLQVNLGVNISVKNPNYFSVDFKKIKAEIFYPINDTPIGDGNATNINFNSNSQTNFTFPFELKYNSTGDTGGQVILDIAQKCGATGQAKQNLVVNYKISLSIRVLLITISPTISNQFNFACPLSSSDISKFITGST